jgi:hypothetical protein
MGPGGQTVSLPKTPGGPGVRPVEIRWDLWKSHIERGRVARAGALAKSETVTTAAPAPSEDAGCYVCGALGASVALMPRLRLCSGCRQHPDAPAAVRWLALARRGGTRPVDRAVFDEVTSRLSPAQVRFLASRLAGGRPGRFPERPPADSEPTPRPAASVQQPVTVRLVIDDERDFNIAPGDPSDPLSITIRRRTPPVDRTADHSKLQASSAGDDTASRDDTRSWLRKAWDQFLLRWGTHTGWRKGEGEPIEAIARVAGIAR